MRAPSLQRTDGRHLKQFLLFAGSVLLPALLLLFFVIRVNRQENELRARRAEEARQRKAEEIGRGMASYLADAEQRLFRELPIDSDGAGEPGHALTSLVFAGRIEEGELHMPWDRAREDALSVQDDLSKELLLRAQQAESTTNDHRQALRLLNRAMSQASSVSQKGLVQLQIGMTLIRSGQTEEGILFLKEILDQPMPFIDEYGIPLALYAADRLSGLRRDPGSVLGKLEELLREGDLLPPAALYFIRDVLESVGKAAPASLPSDEIVRLKVAVESDIARRERIMGLKAYAVDWMSRRDLARPASALRKHDGDPGGQESRPGAR